VYNDSIVALSFLGRPRSVKTLAQGLAKTAGPWMLNGWKDENGQLLPEGAYKY